MSVSLINPWQKSDFVQFVEQLSIEAELHFDNSFKVESITDGRDPKSNSVCFIEDMDLFQAQENVLYIIPQAMAVDNCIVTEDPRYVFIKFLDYIQQNNLYHSQDSAVLQKGVHPNAQISNSAILEDEVVIEKGVVISAGVILKRGTYIGENTIIRENTVVGCPGIALYKAKNGEVLRFPHLAGVKIGSNVEIGANAVVVQGTIEPTIIEDDVVIGNLCNIGHGATIKTKVWMSVGTLIGGYCTIESGATLGLGVSVRNNLRLGDDCSVGMGTVVTKSVDDLRGVFGNPAKPFRNLKTGPKR